MAERPSREKPKRVRAFKPKTATGCITCRIRRIKCDEFKPHCRKCTSTGRRCDGYPIDHRSVPENEKRHFVSSGILPHSPSTGLAGTELEQKSFNFFQHETIPQICGFYPSQFWLQSVLQACHHSPVIRHAAIALGSLHAQYRNRDTNILTPNDDIITGSFTLQQYNKAIHLLLHPISGRTSSQNVDVALITCILFASFEALRGHLGSTLAHIDAGVKILSEAQSKTLETPAVECSQISSTISYTSMSMLNVLFTRLDIQATGFVRTRPLKLVRETGPIPSPLLFEIPIEFETLEEASDSQNCLFSYWLHVSQFPSPFSADMNWKDNIEIYKYEHIKKLKQWSAAFDNHLANRSRYQTTAQKNLHLIHLLHLHHIYMTLYVNTHHGADVDETMWDACNLEFQEMIFHAAAILSSNASNAHLKSLFSLDTGVISPLYFVASRCRHPWIRRQAISLMASANRQEGVWDSKTVARVAQRVMEIEEAGLDILQDGVGIPASARIYGVRPLLDPNGRKAILHYVRQPVAEDALSTERMKEVITW